jgi:hypothetical protein
MYKCRIKLPINFFVRWQSRRSPGTHTARNMLPAEQSATRSIVSFGTDLIWLSDAVFLAMQGAR